MSPNSQNQDPKLTVLRRRAALTLVWERLWPPLAFAGAVVLLFAAASWSGLWIEAPRYARPFVLGLFALALVLALAPLVRVRWPGQRQLLARLDRDAPFGHSPATGLEDALANAGDDPATQALWALHKERLARNVAQLRVAPPAPNLAARDPYALRFVAVLLALIAAFAAGPERFARLAAAFGGLPELSSAESMRVDAWIDPPAYTGKPPIFLKVSDAERMRSVVVPEDSVFVVRADPKVFSITVTGMLAKPGSSSSQERRFEIRTDGTAKIIQGTALLAEVAIKVSPRTAPSIRLLDPPQSNISGSLSLHYAIEDAYGVREANSVFSLVKPDGKTASHTLFGPPVATLSLPEGANGIGEARTTFDLSDHPWAGARVNMTLKATSVSRSSATSPTVEVTLPQRHFANPLAKALVELRRDLVLDPDRSNMRVSRALAAFRLGPDVFDTSPRVYLDLGGIERRLNDAHNDDDLREVAAWLWALALSIENGDAPEALKNLRAAEDKLREALRKGASPSELKALTERLREAAERYLAEQMRNADKQALENDAPTDSKDLDAMLDRLEQDTRSGAKEDAQAMLDELQEMTENLRSAESSQSNPAAKQMRESLRNLGQLLKDQQALRDDTFRQDQRERSGGAPPDDGKGPSSLQDQQKALRDRLERFEKQLRSLGAEAPNNLDDAAKDMQDAERNLQGDGAEGKGKPQRRFGHSAKGDAVDAQGRAIEALRQGRQSMQQKMRGQGKGKGGYVGMSGTKRGDNDDPLGRGQDGRKGAAVGELAGGADRAERARRVLEELRRRLADPNRSVDERDYLERLIGQP